MTNLCRLEHLSQGSMLFSCKPLLQYWRTKAESAIKPNPAAEASRVFPERTLDST